MVAAPKIFTYYFWRIYSMREVLRRALDFLFMTFGLACLYEYKRLVHLKGYQIFIAYLALWWVFIYLVEEKWIINILMFLTISVNIGLLFFLFSKKEKVLSSFQKFVIGLLYIGGGCIFLTMIPYKDNDFAKLLIMGIFILIWVNDTFAYLVGSTIGRTKLFKAVSPKKTIEGTLGGFVFTILASFFLGKWEPIIDPIQWMILAAVIVLFGTLGDLIESKFKRLAEVKDSGAIIPGHGGMLDRLDSMVFAAPFAYLTLNIFAYVS